MYIIYIFCAFKEKQFSSFVIIQWSQMLGYEWFESRQGVENECNQHYNKQNLHLMK